MLSADPPPRLNARSCRAPGSPPPSIRSPSARASARGRWMRSRKSEVADGGRESSTPRSSGPGAQAECMAPPRCERRRLGRPSGRRRLQA
eukprot:1770855-Pyramimonas_sp.AAC.1